MTKKTLPPIHPGEILREEFLLPMGVSQYRLAKEIGVFPCVFRSKLTTHSDAN